MFIRSPNLRRSGRSGCRRCCQIWTGYSGCPAADEGRACSRHDGSGNTGHSRHWNNSWRIGEHPLCLCGEPDRRDVWSPMLSAHDASLENTCMFRPAKPWDRWLAHDDGLQATAAWLDNACNTLCLRIHCWSTMDIPEGHIGKSISFRPYLYDCLCKDTGKRAKNKRKMIFFSFFFRVKVS